MRVLNLIRNTVKNTGSWIRLSHSVFYQRIKRPEAYQQYLAELTFYKKLLSDSETNLIFDIGANIGNKTFIFSKLAPRIISFEPSDHCVHILQERFKNEPIKIIQSALGRSSGEVEFYEIPGNEAYNSLSKKHIETTATERNVTSIRAIKSRMLTVQTLDYYIENIGIPDYIKIDVEGYEIEVIKGLTYKINQLSFESNLPEFLEESIQCISYLHSDVSPQYKFNVAVDTSFLFSDYKSAQHTIQYLEETNLRYVEIYAKLIHEE